MVPGKVQRCQGYTYTQGELRVRVGEERGGKETDGCPLTISSHLIVDFNFDYSYCTLPSSY
jgi:hypothetical protein